MSIFFDAPVPAGALTTFVREVPVNSNLALLTAVPTNYRDTNTIDFAEITRRNRTARYRSFDGRIHVSDRDSATTRQVKMMALSSSVGMGEYERLQTEFARTGGTNTSALANAIYNDAEQLTREVHARLEQALGDVLSDGILTINEGGLVGFEADFGVPATHKPVAAAPWSNPAALILSDLIAWRDVAKDSGVTFGAIRTSQRVITFMLRNTEIVNAVHGAAAARTAVTMAELQTLLADHWLPPIVTPYDTQVDVDGVPTRTIDEDKLLFTPANLGDLVSVESGVSATALELVDAAKVDFAFADAPGITGVVVKEGPPFRQFTFVDAVAMPVIRDARQLLSATVL